mmetsp:Transcript_38822/g.82849  ORF Transcript_38822/g.82849 Transcript_38822/m.82849 type:complete len:728 (-) Transcript_38822:475-2658(-)
MSNYLSHDGNHDDGNESFPFLQLAQAYVSGFYHRDPLEKAAREFECAQLAICMRCVEEFWLGRKDVARRMWREEIVAQHTSRFETTSMINAVHNEKQLRDALNEIGRPDLIGHSEFTALIPEYERRSEKLGRSICAITIKARKAANRPAKRIRQANISQPYVKQIARCELDTRADTTCCGKNFLPLVFTGQTCDVNGFHGDLETISDVPVATCATVWQHHSGRRFLLIFHETLYFGDSMDHSLINPNQMRDFGIDVWDNSYDKERDFGIVADDILIPFETEGSTIFFETFLPTQDDLEKLPQIVLTSEEEWDPLTVNMQRKPSKWIDDNELMIKEMNRNSRNNVPRDDEIFETDVLLSQGINGLSISEQALAERAVKSVRVNSKEVISKHRHSKHTPEHISRLFNVGLNKALEIMNATTQQAIRQAVHPLERRYKTLPDLNKKRLDRRWGMDRIHSNVKSLNQNTGAFILSNGQFTQCYPTRTNSGKDAGVSLQTFCEDVGVPTRLKVDGAKCFEGDATHFKEVVYKNRIDLTFAEAGRHYELQKVDTDIMELKRRVQNKAAEKKVPRRLWDFLAVHQSKMMTFIPRGSSGRTGHEIVTGQTPDISEYLDFDFYDLVWYLVDKHPSTGQQNRQLARWAGVSHRIGTAMCYWLIPVSGRPIAETTVQHVTADDMRDVNIKAQIDEFNKGSPNTSREGVPTCCRKSIQISAKKGQNNNLQLQTSKYYVI